MGSSQTTTNVLQESEEQHKNKSDRATNSFRIPKNCQESQEDQKKLIENHFKVKVHQVFKKKSQKKTERERERERERGKKSLLTLGARMFRAGCSPCATIRHLFIVMIDIIEDLQRQLNLQLG